jgi:pilus assembly protein Flp/PilA
MGKPRNFFKDESGVAALEYALLVALIAVVIIASLTMMGKNLSALFQRNATSVAAA